MLEHSQSVPDPALWKRRVGQAGKLQLEQRHTRLYKRTQCTQQTQPGKPSGLTSALCLQASNLIHGQAADLGLAPML